MISPKQPETPPHPRRRRAWGAVGFSAVLLTAAGCGDDSPQPATPPAPAAPASTAPTGAAAILQAAGPLHAHIENTNQLICDETTATVSASGHGFRVHVAFAGPGNLTVAATSVDQQDANETYTLTAQDTGHDFAFTQFPLSKVQVASVSVTAAAGGGTCDVVDKQG